ncbi:hypothetical protein A3A37_03275 [Candidatus Kaiserbacteria bacterium RIFCSPLOWO2_01_FULL_52_36]|nr:MAG: hypothetical protein A3A37_03275 [Candidatus Kaiserbacteria bacterium RIFCSPLOWO2_01_FULL_52_36]
MTVEHLAVRAHEKMKEVLMHPEAPGPSVHYYMIRGGTEQKNITVWEAGTVGGLPAAPGRPAQAGEYIKTYGHYHVDDLPETYWFLFGEGIALLQKLAVDGSGKSISDVVEEFRAIKVKAEDTLNIPARWGHLAVNTGKSYLVTADDSPVDFADKDPVGMPSHADYENVKKMRGFAYYVVEKDGAPALVKNPLYKEIRRTDFGGLSVIGEAK